MSTNDKGGPAFPVHPDMPSQLGCTPSASDAGMSLRDYFAAAALQGFISAEALRGKDAVRAAYAYADAMLEERK